MINPRLHHVACSVMGVVFLSELFASAALAAKGTSRSAADNHAVPIERPISLGHRRARKRKNNHIKTIAIQNPAICLKDKAICAIAKKHIDEQIKQFRAYSVNAEESEPHGYLKEHCTMLLNKPNVLSAMLTFETYLAGSANSSQSIEVLNVWKRNARKIENNDIIRPESLQDLAVLLAAAAYQQMEPSDALKIMEQLEFKNFALTPDGILFLLDEGDFAATAEGVQKIKLPYRSVGPIMQPALRSEVVEPGTVVSMSQEEWKRTITITAISTLTEILASEPNNATAYKMRAKWYEKLGRPEVAAADNRKAIELDPSLAP